MSGIASLKQPVWLIGLLIFPLFSSVLGQQTEMSDSNSVIKSRLDDLYIQEVEENSHPPKILHAEPLYIDLIRDLGARKGEKEWNVGVGLIDNTDYDKYEALVEYEWAPINRLGLEVELPFSFYYKGNGNGMNEAPKSRLNSLKLAAQYTFLVSPKAKTSLALGYLHEFELAAFADYGKEKFFTGNLYNPFFIAAKRWGNNFHTLVYTGPSLLHHYHDRSLHHTWEVHSNFHYMITGTRNFIGVEFNKEIMKNDFDMVIRPQMRVGIAENLLVGIVAGIPVKREVQRFSAFLRIIWEPGERH